MYNEEEIKKQIIENIDSDIQEFLNVNFENQELEKTIKNLNDHDEFKIKLEILKTLNDSEEILFIFKEIYKHSLDIIISNNLNINLMEDQDLFNEIFYDNYFLCFDIKKDKSTDQKLEIDYIGIYGKEDQGSLNKLQIALTHPFNF